MAAKPRPGGRSARTKSAVFEAAATLVAERGHGAFTMTDVAERAGVAATSLYRRWGDVRALVMEVAVEQLRREHPLPDTGSMADDLRDWGRRIAASLASPEQSSFFAALIGSATSTGEGREARTAALQSRLDEVGLMLKRAQARGEKPPALVDIMDHLLAPLYARALFGAPLNESVADRLVETLLRL